MFNRFIVKCHLCGKLTDVYGFYNVLDLLPALEDVKENCVALCDDCLWEINEYNYLVLSDKNLGD